MPNQFKGGLQTQNKEIAVEELIVEGQIPKWLVGSLIRTAPAQYEVGEQSYRHWFDGLAMLHSFAFQDGRVSYRNRFLESKSRRASKESGKIEYGEFATDPCQTLFKRLKTAFGKPEIGGNGNVNVSRFGDEYVALTETPLAMTFDPQTLETLGVYNYEETDAQLSTAHPHFDFQSKLGITYAAKIGLSNEYRFYNMNGGKLDLLAAVPAKSVSYVHSFGMTEHYLLLAECPLKMSALSMIVSGKPFIENFEWLPDEGSRFIVVDKASGELVSETETEAFFTFHHINAFERDGEIIADFAAYPDTRLIGQYYLDKLRADDAGVAASEFRRYRIPLNGGERATFELLSEAKIEFPRINYERVNGQPYGCVFGASLKSGTTDFYNQLSKIEVADGAVKTWDETDCYPGEPVFVPAPDASAEDAGAILSVVFDSRRGTTFLVILDAQTFTEIARTRLPQHITFGFHGQFFAESSN